jgi:dihydroorotate dehydrogenase (subfamily 1) family protein
MKTKDINLQTQIGDLTLKNPVMTASGCFGYGAEFKDFFDISKLGAIVVKATTLAHRDGNPYPRMCETPSGMINAVGLQNKGLAFFSDYIYPTLKKIDTHIIANVSGATLEDYVAVAEKMASLDKISAIELNISCPNVKNGGMAFGTDPKVAGGVVSAVRKVYNKTLIVKLTPNVTNIADIAQSVQEAGADSVSLINTLLAMAVDSEKQEFVISTKTGGLSGACVKPIALRCVYQVAQRVKIPIIALGGITNAADAMEFILVGASAFEVGTQNFIDPCCTMKILEGIKDYLMRHNITSLDQIRGKLL